MKRKILLAALPLILSSQGISQTFLFSHNTGLRWSDENNDYLQGLILITTNHLGLALNRGGKTGQNQAFYLFDLRKKRVVLSVTDANRGYYWAVPSKSGSFVLQSTSVTPSPTVEDPNQVTYGDFHMAVYRFNAGRQTWSRTLQESYGQSMNRSFEGSWPHTDGYYVKAVKSAGRVQLQFFKF